MAYRSASSSAGGDATILVYPDKLIAVSTYTPYESLADKAADHIDNMNEAFADFNYKVCYDLDVALLKAKNHHAKVTETIKSMPKEVKQKWKDLTTKQKKTIKEAIDKADDDWVADMELMDAEDRLFYEMMMTEEDW